MRLPHIATLLQSVLVTCPAPQHWMAAAQTTPRKNLLFIASDDLRPQLGTYQPEPWAGGHSPAAPPTQFLLHN